MIKKYKIQQLENGYYALFKVSNHLSSERISIVTKDLASLNNLKAHYENNQEQDERTCISCGQKFDSTSYVNRMCGPCKSPAKRSIIGVE